MITSFTFRTPTTDPASTASYADIPLLLPTKGKGEEVSYFIAETSGPISANVKNTGANSITVQVLGGNDLGLADAEWTVVVTATVIAAAASAALEIDLARYHYYKFQQKDTVGASHGATQLRGVHKRV